MPKIIRSRSCIHDLEEIWSFIARDSPVQADKWIGILDQKIRLLAQNAQLGRARSELAEGLRSYPVKNYVIFYLPLELEEGIKLVRILHGSRDIELEPFATE